MVTTIARYNFIHRDIDIRHRIISDVESAVLFAGHLYVSYRYLSYQTTVDFPRNCELYVSRCAERLKLSPRILFFTGQLIAFSCPFCHPPTLQYREELRDSTCEVYYYLFFCAICGRFHSRPAQLLNLLLPSSRMLLRC